MIKGVALQSGIDGIGSVVTTRNDERMGQLVLQTVTCVTVGSYDELHGPVKGSPMATLSGSGVGEILQLREDIQALKGHPIDAAFGALPQRMIGVAGEMLIILTCDERTGLAEVPFMNHPLSLSEVQGVRSVEALRPTSLMLILGNRSKANASFLFEYGADRKEALLDYAETQEAQHVLFLGLPIFTQAVAYAFARGEVDERQVEAIVPRNGSAVQVLYPSCKVLFPDKQPAR